jgi:hypothetical protein
MRKLSLWYGGLGRSTKIALTSVFVIVVVILVAAIGYMLLHPKKVEVKYGTIVRDPIDGHVWSNNTKTAMVDPDKVGDYKVEYVDKYSPQHEKELEAQKASEQAQQQQLAQSQGLQSQSFVVPSDQTSVMQNIQQGVTQAGSSVITGMEMASQIGSTKSTLVSQRNQIAAIPVPAQFESLKQQTLQVFDKYIHACDLYLDGIATADMTKIEEAQNLVSEANAQMQSLLGKAPQ